MPRTPQQAEAAVALPTFPPAVASAPPAADPAAPLAGTKSKEPTAQADSLNLPAPEPESQPDPELAQAPTHDPHQSLAPSPHPKVPPVASPQAGPGHGPLQPGSAPLAHSFQAACFLHNAISFHSAVCMCTVPTHVCAVCASATSRVWVTGTHARDV